MHTCDQAPQAYRSFATGSRANAGTTPLDHETPEEAESYLREYNRWVLQILSIHEAIPGHYTRLVHANRSKSIVKTVFGDGATPRA